MAGAFAGVGFSGFLTNARSVNQLSGPFQTSTLNVGVGPFKFSASLSTGEGSGNSRSVRPLQESVQVYPLAVLSRTL